ncbi:DICT sensory domain-containing protein [Myxacorys almedinensis]|uniref:histidine kinase n=1 Tax=Myxacorys almedinensis A TaxID=2690445 RepID=A0A8J8CGR5_9CYAN|nr:DICT sensory domain-containing protein [Myxacorys almedinensis]NDJ15874.1 GAF domain-containing protein [Myxacorys almedinensis A]
MIISDSVLDALLKARPQARPQMYFKSSMTALSHAMEDQVLAGDDHPLVIASFQRERFYRQEAHRYLRIAERTDQVYVLAAPETDFANQSEHYETIAFKPTDGLSKEWHLVVLGKQYASCLICKERELPDLRTDTPELHVDQARRFEGIWTFDRSVVCKSAELLLHRIAYYRPELAAKINPVLERIETEPQSGINQVDPAPFAERLVTYLQAGQYKLAKAYRAIAEKERKERLVNSITAAVRRSLDPNEILKIAAQELGQVLGAGRCLIYRCKAADTIATLEHEFLNAVCAAPIPSLAGRPWTLQGNPLFEQVVQEQEPVYIQDTQADDRLSVIKDGELTIQALAQDWRIHSWLMVPVLHQNQLLGMVELHFCDPTPHELDRHELEMIEAIATQIGVALIQAEAFENLEDLNQQLEALDRTRSNLIAITGHELRTPLSTIQVCLESLASEPDMSPDLRQVMLNSALTDGERMRKLIQDFLTLSRLESGRIEWKVEPLPLWECVDLALSSLQARRSANPIPQIITQLSTELPLVQVDGEWLVEVLSKLLDNACKFTDAKGRITIQAQRLGTDKLEVTVSDTGRGIEANRLETVFDRFYQEEGALRRTTGGTGLGLAICRQIITNWGGQIWAESGGKDCGSQFHFTVPIVPLEEKQSMSTRRKRNT